MDTFSKEDYVKELLNNTSGNALDAVIHDLRNRVTGLITSSFYMKSILNKDGSEEAKILDSIETLAYDISNIIEAYAEYIDTKKS